MFVDKAKIYVKAGAGGDGCVAFRREKFVPKGGPSGGDGGQGGDVILRSTAHLNTLLPFRYKQHYKARKGAHGSGNNRQGKSGESVRIDVPLGTLASDADSMEHLIDLVEEGQTFTVAKGGRGGRGNARFVSSTNQAPRYAEPGESGQERTVILELKILADVGIVGYPNAGKSTLISVLSSARPKIAGYPFTTLSPQLGVVLYEDFRTLVVADIPGLIEGAHEGSGLGDRFLRHVERCRVLVHLIDVSADGEEDPVQAYLVVNRELGLYDSKLSLKPQLVVASKLDAVLKDRRDRLQIFCTDEGIGFHQVSAATGAGIPTLKQLMMEYHTKVDPS